MMGTLIQALGVAAISVGLWMLAPWLGVTVMGVFVLMAGVVLELEARNGTRQSVPTNPTP